MSAEIPFFLDVTVTLPGVKFLQVRRWTLTEALNAWPEMTVEVFGDEPDIDMTALLGQSACVELREAAVPRFDGVVRHVEQQLLDLGSASLFVLTIVPRPWLLTKRSGHRIFQDRTALQIVADVLAPYGAEMDAPEGIILQRALPAYEYRVQCGETDHDFVARLLAEHGLVSLWSPNAEGKRRWIVTDDTTAGSAEIVLPYRPASGALSCTDPHVTAATVVAQLCSSEARLRDYDPRKPAFLLERRHVSADGVEVEGPLSRYDFGVGRFDDERKGEVLAQRRLEELRARSRVYRWEASLALRPGMRVRLEDHPRDDANGDFVVVSARSEVEKGRRTHVAEVVPADQPWRPAPIPKPRIHGTQTAFVVGAPGKEIDVDAEARIAVHFVWDTRPEGASRRVRIATPWAGLDRGFWTLPRVGDEVVVAYLDGDPDQPLVVGSVHNAVAPPALPMPACERQSWWRSRSTPGGEGYNAILMQDTAGDEILALYAERDHFTFVGRRSQTTIGEDEIVQVKGSRTVRVGGGANPGAGDVTTAAAGASSLTAKTIALHSTADMEILCDGSRTDTTTSLHAVGAGNLVMAGVASATLSGGTVGVYAQGDGGTIEVEAAAQIELRVGGSSIRITPDKITLSAPLIELNP